MVFTARSRQDDISHISMSVPLPACHGHVGGLLHGMVCSMN
jgi:hypothetical protein